MVDYDMLLSEEDFRDLAETAHILSELEHNAAFLTFKEILEGECRAHQDFILSGKPKTMEEFRYHTGVVAGILSMLNLPGDWRGKYVAEAGRRDGSEDAEEVGVSG